MYYNDYNRNDDFRDDVSAVEPVTVEKPKKKRTGMKVAALCLACALVGGIAGGAATARLFPDTRSLQTTVYEGTAPAAVTVADVKAGQALTMSQVYAANVGSTVGITTELVTTNFWGQRVKGAAAGSGFVISSDGYILTNYHVIKGATSIQVAFVDGTTYPATLIGGEELNDIAVLKIDATGLTPVVLGDSDTLVVGEQVGAIGNPLGELTFTLTVGYVSAKDRAITFSDGKTLNMIQTDTAINSGNSGGALFNSYGQVIGITTAKYSSDSASSSASVEGIGFAIPINDVKSIVKDLMEKGYVTGKPNVGILMEDVSTQAQRYGIPAGTYVEAVLEGSCADKAGLQAGDIITAVNDTAITSSSQLASAVKAYKAGDTVTFTVYRDKETTTLDITLDEWTTDREQAMTQLQQDYAESQQQEQQEQQQSQQGNNGYGWGYGNNGSNGFSWSFPFGWGW